MSEFKGRGMSACIHPCDTQAYMYEQFYAHIKVPKTNDKEERKTAANPALAMPYGNKYNAAPR